jgi:hypothetical protein
LTTRYDVERAIEQSGLPVAARDIVFALCRRMQVGSTLIQPQHSPSLSQLARATGWSRRTIQRYLRLLEEAEFIDRRRPPPHLARTAYMTTHYVIRGVAGLGPRGPSLESGGPGLETGRTGSLESGGPGLETGRTANQISSDLDSDRETDPEIAIVVHEIFKRTGRIISAQFAAKTRDLILARPGIRNRGAYLRRVLATDPDPGRFLPAELPGDYCKRCGQRGHEQKECKF